MSRGVLRCVELRCVACVLRILHAGDVRGICALWATCGLGMMVEVIRREL